MVDAETTSIGFKLTLPNSVSCIQLYTEMICKGLRQLRVT